MLLISLTPTPIVPPGIFLEDARQITVSLMSPFTTSEIKVLGAPRHLSILA
jgi:hypothetical protein